MAVLEYKDIAKVMQMAWAKAATNYPQNGWEAVAEATIEYVERILTLNFKDPSTRRSIELPEREYDKCPNCGWATPHKCKAGIDPFNPYMVWTGYDVLRDREEHED